MVKELSRPSRFLTRSVSKSNLLTRDNTHKHATDLRACVVLLSFGYKLNHHPLSTFFFFFHGARLSIHPSIPSSILCILLSLPIMSSSHQNYRVSKDTILNIAEHCDLETLSKLTQTSKVRISLQVLHSGSRLTKRSSPGYSWPCHRIRTFHCPSEACCNEETTPRPCPQLRR